MRVLTIAYRPISLYLDEGKDCEGKRQKSMKTVSDNSNKSRCDESNDLTYYMLDAINMQYKGIMTMIYEYDNSRMVKYLQNDKRQTSMCH